MRPKCVENTDFIRRHCGSVAIEAPSGRATGAQRPFLTKGLSVHLLGNGVCFHSNHPAGASMSLTGILARQGGWNGNAFRSLEDGPTALS